MSETSLREARMMAADAARLRDDPALKDVLDHIRARAIGSAIYDTDAGTREQGRQLVVAVDYLRGEIENRVQTALEIERRKQTDRIFE